MSEIDTNQEIMALSLFRTGGGCPSEELQTDKVIPSGDWEHGVCGAGVLHCMPLDEFVLFIRVD